jgi:hypothetical protein
MKRVKRAGWNSWHHCTGSTYGAWLRGDPPGWRSKQHREHVDGDYKRPPPAGRYKELEAHFETLDEACLRRVVT